MSNKKNNINLSKEEKIKQSMRKKLGVKKLPENEMIIIKNKKKRIEAQEIYMKMINYNKINSKKLNEIIGDKYKVNVILNITKKEAN